MNTKISLENSVIDRKLNTKIIINDSSLIWKTAYFQSIFTS